MSKIITITRPSSEIDVNREFVNYKYAIPEHSPIRLSDGSYLHTYRVTRYNDFDPQGDQDVEDGFAEREIYG